MAAETPKNKYHFEGRDGSSKNGNRKEETMFKELQKIKCVTKTMFDETQHSYIFEIFYMCLKYWRG